MRLFLRRLIIIIILLIVIYLIYGWLNPAWAEKIKSQLNGLDLPREQARERASELLIKEVDETNVDIEENIEDSNEDNSEDPIAEKEVNTPRETEKEVIKKEVKQQEAIEEWDDVLRDYLEAELKDAIEIDAENNEKQDEAVLPAEEEIVLKKEDVAENEGELSDEELAEIQELLRSLLEE